MGLFDFLFGKKPALSLQRPQQQDMQVEQGFTQIGTVEIKSKNFYGECSQSQDKCYTIAWGDARYFLLEGKQIVVTGKMARPNDGKVANNGTFILNDWGLGEGRKGTFCAFDSKGIKLIARKFTANLYTNGIASDGHLAACQALEADSSDDSTLVIFDLKQGIEIGAWVPESDWADYYDFSADGFIRLGYRNLGAFRYTMAGEFIERDIWQDAQLTKGDCESTLAMIERMIKQSDGKLSFELAAKLIKGADRALSMANTDARKQARAMKLRGICLDAQGALHDALGCYDKALALDPKIGVKRRAEQIRKILSAEAKGTQ